MFALIRQTLIESFQKKTSNSLAILFALVGTFAYEGQQYVFAAFLFALAAAVWSVVFMVSHKKAKKHLKKTIPNVEE